MPRELADNAPTLGLKSCLPGRVALAEALELLLSFYDCLNRDRSKVCGGVDIEVGDGDVCGLVSAPLFPHKSLHNFRDSCPSSG